MRSYTLGRGVPCVVVLVAAWLAPKPAGAVRLIRHFPTNTWCSMVSGFSLSPPPPPEQNFELVVPYPLVVPAGQSKVTLIFKANNVSPSPNEGEPPQWNRQGIDSVVVLRKVDLPVGHEARCFFGISEEGFSVVANAPPLFPLLQAPAAFRDDFVGGAKAEWGPIPTGNASGQATGPAYWLPPGTPPSNETATVDVFHENFDDGLDQDWTVEGIPGAESLWLRATQECSPESGSRHVAFTRPEPDCFYQVEAAENRVGGDYMSPIIDLGGLGFATLEFRHRWDTGGNDQTWSVETSSNGGASWTPQLLESDFGSFGSPRAVKIDIPSPTSQFRVRFRFDSGTSPFQIGTGWFIDNIRITTTRGPSDGSLRLGRSDNGSGTFVDDGEVTARLNVSGLVPGEYAVMVKWTAGNGSDNAFPSEPDDVHLSVEHLFDSTAPTNPTLTSPSHVPNVWSQNAQVTVQWSGAADAAGGAGLAGYSTLFDTSAATTPDTTLDTPQASDPHSFSSGVLADGGSYYFHLRACDFAFNCAAATHLGPFRIDRTAPSPVSGLTSPSHTVGVPSLDRTIDIAWSPATDAASGVDGYAFTFDNNATWVCDQIKDAEEGATGVTSATLAPGSWYFHICTRDNAGNWSAMVADRGPFPLVLDTVPPQNPTLGSPTHTVNVWSNLNVVTVTWSGATDAGGLAGYSVLFDTSAGTTPNTSVDVAHSGDPHSISSVPLADGASYYFHLRTCDVAQNCNAAVHLGPFRIDQTPPGPPTSLASPSHAVGVPSPDSTIDVTWQPAVDASSGVDGYSFTFDGSATWNCDQTVDVQETGAAATSEVLGPGSWYFHICTRDNAGNWSAVASAGPYMVSGLRLYTLTPCRLVDTRAAQGPFGGPSLVAGGQRTFQADSSPTCVIPSTAKALTVNATVVSPSAPGNLRFYAGGSAVPLVSALNYSAGQTRSNNGIVPLNAAREFTVRCEQASGTTHFVLDVTGYFE